MTQLSIRHYDSAGGVVIDRCGAVVLVLLLPAQLGPDGQPEVRLPKGHIEPGESRPQAAVREVSEETGLSDLEIVADLGWQRVEFDFGSRHVVRDESYFLMVVPDAAQAAPAEPQFRPFWLSWDEALAQTSYEPEREWIRRARQAWSGRGKESQWRPERT